MPLAKATWISSTPMPNFGRLAGGRKKIMNSPMPMPVSQSVSSTEQMERAYALYFSTLRIWGTLI